MGKNLVLDLLKRWESWEADLLNDDNPSIIDDLSGKQYEEMMELQKLRNEAIDELEMIMRVLA